MTRHVGCVVVVGESVAVEALFVDLVSKACSLLPVNRLVRSSWDLEKANDHAWNFAVAAVFVPDSTQSY